MHDAHALVSQSLAGTMAWSGVANKIHSSHKAGSVVQAWLTHAVLEATW